MFIIGEKINTTLDEAKHIVAKKDKECLQSLAKQQIDAGAGMVDINVGTRVKTEAEDMVWAIKSVQEAINTPCCIDSPNPKVLEAGLKAHKGKAVVNSITAEKKRMEDALPVLKEYDCKVVALAMDDEGIPEDEKKRHKVATHLIEKLQKEGFSLDDIYIDPLVRPISTNSDVGKTVLKSINRIADSFPQVHIICGLSNISFGLPKRELLNRTFLAMAMTKGLDAAILDPLDKNLMATIISATALLGEDKFCANYLAGFREGKI